MRISVVVPVYNEEETVAQVLESLAQVPLDLEVIVVDDASTDRTWEILQAIRQKAPFHSYRFIRHDYNQGKGVGLRTGFALVSGELVTVQDADIEPEITACILQAGYNILEVPISYTPRKAKKLSPWKDGWPALAMLLRRRFTKRFQFTPPPTMSDTSTSSVVEKQRTHVRQ